jgi:hypothetical protein
VKILSASRKSLVSARFLTLDTPGSVIPTHARACLTVFLLTFYNGPNQRTGVKGDFSPGRDEKISFKAENIS